MWRLRSLLDFSIHIYCHSLYTCQKKCGDFAVFWICQSTSIVMASITVQKNKKSVKHFTWSLQPHRLPRRLTTNQIIGLKGKHHEALQQRVIVVKPRIYLTKLGVTDRPQSFNRLQLGCVVASLTSQTGSTSKPLTVRS